MISDVSVLIPAYGESPFLLDTLNSVSRNSVQPSEILVIDDGLSKKIVQDIEIFSSTFQVKVIKSEGKGLVEALNTGLKKARYKFICRIDNDDLMLENRIERQLHHFETNKKIVAVGSQCIYIDSSNKETGISRYPNGDISENSEFPFQCLIAHPSSMYLREAALKINGYRSLFKWNNIDIAEDFDFWLRLSKLGEIQIFNEYLTKYRQHANQLSTLNSFAQRIGTPYISAVNKANLENPRKLEFISKDLSEKKFLIQIIKKYLGYKKASSIYLLFFHLENPQFFKVKFLSEIFNKLVNFFYI